MVDTVRSWLRLKDTTATGRRRRYLISCSLQCRTKCVEADWSVEIGADLPLIAVPWEGFVDLRRDLAAAHELRETTAAPMLGEALIDLNQEASPVFTSKCDFWLLTADEI